MKVWCLENLSVQKIASLLSQFTGGTVVQAHRFKHRDSNKPIPVVKISCTPHAANLIKTHSLAFYGETVVVEDFYKNHRPDISCFRCQERGHTAPWCPIHSCVLVLNHFRKTEMIRQFFD